MNRGNKTKKTKTTKAGEARGREAGALPLKRAAAEDDGNEAGRKRLALGNITNAAQNKANRQQQLKVALPHATKRATSTMGRREARPVQGQQAEEEEEEMEEDVAVELEPEQQEEAEQQQEEGEEMEEEGGTDSAVSSSSNSSLYRDSPLEELSGSTMEQEMDYKKNFRGKRPSKQDPLRRNPRIPKSRPVPGIKPPADKKFRIDSNWLAKNLPADTKVVNCIPQLPPVPTQLGVLDVDNDDKLDWVGMSVYSRGIFEYYKLRETKFLVEPYMEQQNGLTPGMRAVLVDWLVELQENFELNHETLYLGVRIIDTYLSRVPVSKEKLQITGAVCLFIACKYDERIPPSLEELRYICDNAYDRDSFVELEREVFRAIDFDIGMPLSYRFLRRYARCAQTSSAVLTLARYILELSLMDYQFVGQLESRMAASALYLALRMKNEGSWDNNLRFHTGYNEGHIMPVVMRLNHMLHSKNFLNLKTIETKYSHKVFHQVAKTPLLDMADL